jgi:hypothetical protein
MKEWLRRALRTFVQAITGYIAANLVCTVAGIEISDGNELKVAIIGLIGSAIAAGVAAVMNIIPLNNNANTDKEETEE